MPRLSRFYDFPSLKRLREILLYADLEFSELVTSIAALTWGLWLLAPWVELQSNTRLVMNAMSEIAPDYVWAFAAITLGSIQAFALTRDLAHVRAVVSGIAFFMWFSISILFAIIQPESPHAPLYGILAFAAGWAHLRAALLRVHGTAARVAAANRASDL